VCDAQQSSDGSATLRPTRCTTSPADTLFVCNTTCAVVSWTNVTSGILASASVTLTSVLTGVAYTYVQRS
jgi:hypothetical protein